MPRSLTLTVLPDLLVIARLDRDDEVPEWADINDFWSVTRTNDELSIVCEQADVPDDVKCDRGWRALKIESPLDLSEVGIVLSLAQPLADAGVSIFTLSTYETDYVLVRDSQLDAARAALTEKGHTIRE